MEIPSDSRFDAGGCGCAAAEDDGPVKARAALKDLVFEGRREGECWCRWLVWFV